MFRQVCVAVCQGAVEAANKRVKVRGVALLMKVDRGGLWALPAAVFLSGAKGRN